jgi:anti-sigma-K factor RskA
MSDIHALSGAYAIDALDDDERSQFEKHLEVCPECRAEVQSFTETSALIAETQAETPPPSLRDSVLSGIGSVRPLPPEPDATAAPAETANAAATVHTLHRRTLPFLVAASVALILLAVGGGLVYHAQHNGSSTTNLADQIMQAPDAVRVTEPVPGGGQLTIVRSASLKRAVMVGSEVPAPKPGTTYQMWLQQPGLGMVSAGLMPDADHPTVLTGDAATAEAAAVSVEPEAGSPEPTSDPIALFPLQTPATGNGST